MKTTTIAIGLAILAGCTNEPTIAPGSVGAACAEDLDCALGLSCFRGAEGARVWPDGYCTRSCEMDDCPSGARCGPLYVDASGEIVLSCLADCDRVAGARGTCREGYTCRYDGVCSIGCTSDAECELDDTNPGRTFEYPGSMCELESSRCVRGGGAGNAGDICDADEDCRGPSSVCADGVCEPTNCDLGGPYACVDGEVCVAAFAAPYDVLLYECARTCTAGVDGTGAADDRCGATLACHPAADDLSETATTGFCHFPQGVAVMSVGTRQVGDPCVSSAECPSRFGMGGCSSGGFCSIVECNDPAFASIPDFCPEGTVCFYQEPLTGLTRTRTRQAEAGVCLRDCSANPLVCSSPTICNDDGLCGVSGS